MSNNNIVIPKIIGFLLIPFSGFFLTTVLTVSPVYIFFLLALFGTVLYIGTKPKITSDRIIGVMLIYLLYIIFSQSLLDPESSSFVNIVLNLGYFLLCLIIVNKLKIKDIVVLSRYFIWFSIILLIFEAFYRISNPVFQLEGGRDYRDMNGLEFYAYKISSIMFSDSNFVGTFALILFFFNFYLIKKKLIRNKISLFIIPLIIFLTFSRSAIFSCVLCLLILPYILGNRKHIFQKFIIGSLAGATLIYILPLFAQDTSFISKFRILDLTRVYLLEANPVNLLFGVGFGNTVNYLGIGAHNLFVTYLIESGIIGLFLFIFTQLYVAKKSGKESLYITIPLFVSGFSLVGHAIPYYFSSLAVIYILTKKLNAKWS